MHTPAAVRHLILCLRAVGVSEYIHVRAWMRQERTTDDSGDTHDDLHNEDHQSVSILDLHCNPPWIAHLQHIYMLNLNGYLYIKEPRALWSILHNQLLPLYPNATPIPFVSNAPPLLQ